MNQIAIKLFASLKESLGTEEVHLALAGPTSIDHIVNLLADNHGSEWLVVLNSNDVKVAVNQTLVDRQHEVKVGDEVAFLPPVTGG